MTSHAQARIAGVAFLAYIALGLTQLAMTRQVTAGAGGAAATLARYGAYPLIIRGGVLLVLAEAFCAIALGASLYVLTREQDPLLALLAMLCRVCEGVVNAMSATHELGVLRIATGAVRAGGLTDATAAAVIGGQSGASISGICFAVGSALFAWLFLQARSIPRWLAWLGVAASMLLVVLLPLQVLGFVRGLAATLGWMPMLVFELTIAGWFIVRGVRPPAMAPDALTGAEARRENHQ
jgi:Domain of unknown function (DUF4386)